MKLCGTRFRCFQGNEFGHKNIDMHEEGISYDWGENNKLCIKKREDTISQRIKK